MPRVVHCRREKYDVYIGRPGKWGNPFRIGMFRGYTREDALEDYRRWVSGDLSKRSAGEPPTKEAIQAALKGKTLGCWCAPLACHGDILLEIANAEQESQR